MIASSDEDVGKLEFSHTTDGNVSSLEGKFAMSVGILNVRTLWPRDSTSRNLSYRYIYTCAWKIWVQSFSL